MADDSYHGQVKITYKDGRTYKGSFVDGKPHGIGTLTTKQHITNKNDNNNNDNNQQTITYKGEFVNGLQHGKGTNYHPNGDEYSGEFRQGQLTHGEWKTKINGSSSSLVVVYKGHFENNEQPSGQGTAYNTNGSVLYKGQWKEGEPHGKGVMNYANGDEYNGDWVNGNKEGNGVMTYKSGEVYEGEWRGDVRCGKGIIRFLNGDVFSGEWVGRKREGGGGEDGVGTSEDGGTNEVEDGDGAKRRKVEVSP